MAARELPAGLISRQPLGVYGLSKAKGEEAVQEDLGGGDRG